MINESSSTVSSLILMSTYNGEAFLAEQIESIIAQSFTHWTLLIRDDGSTDKTHDIIQQYVNKDSRIVYHQDHFGNVNAINSFSLLLQEAAKRHETFIFFCDQDDIWLTHKLAQQISLLQEMQNRYTETTPILVHSDLTVVDDQLNLIHPSFIAYEKLRWNTQIPTNTLLINNYVTGCTIGMNKALVNFANPVPKACLMHDWWCALCAAASGKIGFIKEPTLLYRQHSKNTIGSKGFNQKYKEILKLKTSIIKRKNNLKRCIKQANQLQLRIDQDKPSLHLISGFATLANKHLLSRYIAAIKLQLKPAGFMRQLAFWLMLASIKA